jgi:hypothetical protein
MNGETEIKPESKGLIYSVPFSDGSTYQWDMPAGIWITSDKRTHSVTVDVDHQSGFIEVTETSADGCKLEPSRLWVNIKD